MVLGANLYNIKAGSASNICNGPNPLNSFNGTARMAKLLQQGTPTGFNEEVVRNTLALTKGEELAAPKN